MDGHVAIVRLKKEDRRQLGSATRSRHQPEQFQYQNEFTLYPTSAIGRNEALALPWRMAKVLLDRFRKGREEYSVWGGLSKLSILQQGGLLRRIEYIG